MSRDRRNESANAHRYWSRRWSSMMEDLFSPEASGQPGQRGVRVRQLRVSAGRIDATVHQRGEGDCDIVAQVTPLDDAQWEALVDLLAGQALYGAQLLAGEMPAEIDRTLERAGISLFPASRDEITFGCTCHQDHPHPCPAAFAVTDAVGEMLNDDPWLIFRLRGRERQALLRMLQSRRNRVAGLGGEVIDTDASALVYRGTTGPSADDAPGLSEQLDGYWGRSREQLDFQHVISPPLVETALLRRLGPPPFDGGVNSQDALAEVYRTVTRNGLALAFAPEPETDLVGDESADPDLDEDLNLDVAPTRGEARPGAGAANGTTAGTPDTD